MAVTVTFVLAAGLIVLMGNVTVLEKEPMATDEGTAAIDGALLLNVKVALFETVEARVMVPVAVAVPSTVAGTMLTVCATAA